MKRNAAILLSLVIIIVIVVAGLFIVLQKKSYKVHDVTSVLSCDSEPVGTSYLIKDKVIDASTFELPKVSGTISNYVVDVNDISTYTTVRFESEPDVPLFFIGNRTNDFKAGETVEFELEVKSYEGIGGTYRCVESSYIVAVLYGDLLSAVGVGDYSVVSFQIDVINVDEYNLTVTDLSEFPDEKIPWSEVAVTGTFKNGTTNTTPSIEVYNSSSSFLGTLSDEKNPLMLGYIQVGDTIRVVFDAAPTVAVADFFADLGFYYPHPLGRVTLT